MTFELHLDENNLLMCSDCNHCYTEILKDFQFCNCECHEIDG